MNGLQEGRFNVALKKFAFDEAVETKARTIPYIETIAIGSHVKVGGGRIDAIVLSIMIGTEGAVSYKCSWWDSNTRVESWLERSEVVWTEKTTGIRIGFLANPKEVAT